MTLLTIFTWVKKNLEEKLLQGMQSANILKACAGAKNANGTVVIVKT